MTSDIPRYPHRRREQLLHFLAEAAELEHNLLCCYLYAAFSLKRGMGEGLSQSEYEAVTRWRELIVKVAQEEMAHLVVVNNLIVAIGGLPHLNRPNFPVAAGYHPGDIVVALTPFDEETLDHFIFLERSSDTPVVDGDTFEGEEYTRRLRRDALMPGAFDYATIGEFYAEIRRSFVSAAAQLGEHVLFSGDPGAQLSPANASLEGVSVITDLASALIAMDFIVIQGEGSTASSGDSHFDRFCRIRTEYAELLRLRPGFKPARPVARNPVMRAPLEGATRVHIDDAGAAPLIDLANALYNHLLRLIAQAYARSSSEQDAQRLLIEAAIQLMGLFSSVAEHLTTLPASAAHPETHAGVSFAILRAIEPLAHGRSEWAILTERFSELARGMRLACADPKLQGRASQLDALAEQFAQRMVI